MSTTVQGRATSLAIHDTMIQQAFDFLNNTIWSETDSELAAQYAKVEAKRIEFSLVCDDCSARIHFKIWSIDPKNVRDGIVASNDPFWKKFHAGLNELLTTPLEKQPCIL
jgi:hypothetical protein